MLDFKGIVGFDVEAIRVFPVPPDGLGLVSVGSWEILATDDAFGCEVMVKLGQALL